MACRMTTKHLINCHQGAGLAACASDDVSAVQGVCVLHAHTSTPTKPLHQALSRLTMLRFEFYSERSRDGSPPGRRVLEVPSTQLHDDVSQLLRDLATAHNVPTSMRFKLLHRIQLARAFGDLATRRQSIRIRLLAFYVLFQSNPGHDELARLFAAEPEFVSELVGLLRAEKEVPEDIRTLALRALAVQLLDRARHTSVIAAISGAGQGSVLSTLLHGSVASLTGASAGLTCSVSFVEAVLSLVGALVASTSGCTALSDAGVIPALLPLFGDSNPQHLSLVSSAVRILESFMDVNPSAGVLLRELGGLSDMLQRLHLELGLVEGVPVADPVPYGNRLLIKGVLRAVAMVSYTPAQGGARTAVRVCWYCMREHAHSTSKG